MLYCRDATFHKKRCGWNVSCEMNFIFLAMAENSKVLLEDAFRNKLINFIPYIELEGLTKADVGNFGSISIAYWPKLRKNVAVKRLFVSEHDTASRNFVHEVRINVLNFEHLNL